MRAVAASGQAIAQAVLADFVHQVDVLHADRQQRCGSGEPLLRADRQVLAVGPYPEHAHSLATHHHRDARVSINRAHP